MPEDIGEWILKEAEERGWSLREVARRADLSQSGLSHVINGDRNPGPELCLGLAKAFNYPPESVFRKAGLLPPEPSETGRLRRLLWMINQLSPERRQLLEEYLTFLLQQDEETAAHTTA
jgi:transcriptional regulator with XRE-family HTH domain